MPSSYRFSSQFLNQLRERLPISQVIGRHVKLQSKGRGEYLGLCPFHNEKTPSFTVSDDKGFYHCFGCGAHGDVVKFVTDHTGASFSDTVTQLAQEAGMSLPKRDEASERQYRKQQSLQEVMELAGRFYEQQLQTQAGRSARDYLVERQVNAETIRLFRLGYAPEGNALIDYMKTQNVTLQQLQACGLILQKDGRAPYPRFRNRLIFPIANARGHVIAFGGRILGDGEPKYLNSPETELFHKGHVLYNLHHAKPSAFKENKLIVVEGYMDAIALYQAGIPYVVAPLGTSMTEHHMRSCWSICDEPVMCLDGDAAGWRAMERSADLALRLLTPGKSLRYLRLPEKKDPDDVIKEVGSAGFLSMLSATRSLSETIWMIHRDKYDLNTPEQKARLEAELKHSIEQIPDRRVRKYYADMVFEEMRALQYPSRKTDTSQPAERARIALPESNVLLQTKRRLLRHMLHHPELLHQPDMEEQFLSLELDHPSDEALRVAIMSYIEENPAVTADNLRSYLENNHLKNHIELLDKSSYYTLFELPTSSADVIKASWSYYWARYEQLLLEREYEHVVMGHEVDTLWELKQQKDVISKQVALSKQHLEELLEIEPIA